MSKQKLKSRQLKKLGLEHNEHISLALGIVRKYYKYAPSTEVLAEISKEIAEPQEYVAHKAWKQLAEKLMKPENKLEEVAMKEATPYTVFGEGNISESAKHQMYQAMKLPVTVEGALMPDAHHGYGLPIGGVLATNNAVIPYAVGVDIGCRMCLSIYRDSPLMLHTRREELSNVLQKHTKFGLKEVHERPNSAEVLENSLFGEIPMLKRLQKTAYRQLGTSGGGNHFVEFGIVDIPEDSKELNLKKGQYLGLLSHSGSRGLGANIAKHFTGIARNKSNLSKNARKLAWLDLESEEGCKRI